MKHMNTPLRRLVPQEDFALAATEPVSEPQADPLSDDPQGDEAWRDALAEHASMQVRFRR